jgi:hypothetical protein
MFSTIALLNKLTVVSNRPREAALAAPARSATPPGDDGNNQREQHGNAHMPEDAAIHIHACLHETLVGGPLILDQPRGIRQNVSSLKGLAHRVGAYKQAAIMDYTRRRHPTVDISGWYCDAKKNVGRSRWTRRMIVTSKLNESIGCVYGRQLNLGRQLQHFSSDLSGI